MGRLLHGGDTCVIGAGFSGLAAARALIDRGQPFVCLERTHGIGGLWRHPGDGGPSPAYRSLHLNTARNSTAFKGFPMSDDYPVFPSHQQVAAYLEQFAEHIGLTGHVEFGTEVISVSERDTGWNVTSVDTATGERQTRHFRNVVVASGHHNEPELPEPFPGEETFTGERIHSVDYSDATPYVGKKVLVVGIGASACDISVELSSVTSRTIVSMRRGAHVLPKQFFGVPLDTIGTNRWWARMPFRMQRRVAELLLHVVHGPVTRYGLPDPGHRLFSAPVTISDHLLNRISHGHITAKPGIERFAGDRVHFADGTSEAVDAVITCTGYRIALPFLKPRHAFQVNGQVALYRRVVARTHPGLYFIGLFRPFGAQTRPIEAQAEWVAELIDGTAALPSWTEMNAEIDNHLGGVNARLGPSPLSSIQIDVGPYLRALERERAEGKRRAATLTKEPAAIPAFAGLG